MASSFSSATLPLLFLLLCSHAAVESANYPGPAAGGASRCTRMFSFGDSITDTGNLVISFAPNASAAKSPYGETFFRRPTGRFCDGRLIVDFLAEALRLPLLAPFLGGKTANDFRHGVNFAVAATTALSQDFFKEMGLDLAIIPPYSLEVQMKWFRRVLRLLGPTDQERKDIMSNSLFLMGEVGINDYNHPFLQNRSFTAEIKPLVPKVISKIENAIKVLIDLGAKTIVVPGNPPIGCVPRYLTIFQSKNPNDYDAFGCLKWLNDFSEYHNHALKSMLEKLPRDPTITISYGDYYGAILEITRNPLNHGFTKDSVLTACCGDGGPYNSNSLFSCNATSILCPNPSKYISWDGLHLTEAAYQFVAHGMLQGRYAVPAIPSNEHADPSILAACKCIQYK